LSIGPQAARASALSPQTQNSGSQSSGVSLSPGFVVSGVNRMRRLENACAEAGAHEGDSVDRSASGHQRGGCGGGGELRVFLKKRKNFCFGGGAAPTFAACERPALCSARPQDPASTPKNVAPPNPRGMESGPGGNGVMSNRGLFDQVAYTRLVALRGVYTQAWRHTRNTRTDREPDRKTK